MRYAIMCYLKRKRQTMKTKANREFILKCFNTVSSVEYDGTGNISIIGKGLRKEPYIGFLGNAQLAGNLAKAVSEDYNATFKKVEKVAF